MKQHWQTTHLATLAVSVWNKWRWSCPRSTSTVNGCLGRYVCRKGQVSDRVSQLTHVSRRLRQPIFICRFPSPHRGLLYLKSPNPLRDHWKESLQWVNAKPTTSRHLTTIPLCTLWNSSDKAISTSVMRSVSRTTPSPTLKHPTTSLPRSSIRSSWKHISSIGYEETLNEEPLSNTRAVLLCRIFHKKFQKTDFFTEGKGVRTDALDHLRLTAPDRLQTVNNPCVQLFLKFTFSEQLHI